jgi:hypothetical protein
MQASQLSKSDHFYRTIGLLTTGILSLFLTMGIVVLSLAWLLPPSGDHYIDFHPSPSGHMKAAFIGRAGGGGISPYCDEAIAVAPTAVVEEELMTGKFDIFSSGDCGRFADHSPSPTIEWVSNEKLKVSFSIKGTAKSMRSVQLRGRDLSGYIGIEFKAHE